ncbi:hypothetical protein V2647_10290 [Tenacibaculum maritimum]|uniref:hypothetical protein n=1 Tax=Tenacibaculum maritimum TaxID=107401 RepID=UPI003876F1ED
MSRLSLDAFKAQSDSSQIQELESLTGGVMASCHCTCEITTDGGLAGAILNLFEVLSCDSH